MAKAIDHYLRTEPYLRRMSKGQILLWLIIWHEYNQYAHTKLIPINATIACERAQITKEKYDTTLMLFQNWKLITIGHHDKLQNVDWLKILVPKYHYRSIIGG